MASALADTRTERLTLAAFALVVLMGGVNFVAVRFSNRELPPFWGATVRFGAAALLLFAVVAVQRIPLPRGRALVGALTYGLLAFGVGFAFGYWGLLRVPAGVAAVVLASAPLFTFVLAFVQRQEQFQWRALAGALVAVGGIAVMFGTTMTTAIPPLSLLALVAMALCFAEASVVAKQFPKSHPVGTNAVAMAVGAALLLVISTIRGEPRVIPAQASTWLALGYLVALGSSAMFVLYLFVLKQWTASTTAYQFVLFPVVAVALSAWLEHAPVTAPLALGGGLVLAGVYAGAIARPTPDHAPTKMGCEPCLSTAHWDGPVREETEAGVALSGARDLID